ncbi:MAG TPA: S41 family peptidase [Pirellulales bacterium]|jgi:carboxyl-terminal processing protease|nr:S41 family peptidase [Pirellulales bacterium]
MPRRTLVLLCLTAIVSLVCYRRAHQLVYARYFSEVMDNVDRYYVEPVDNQKLFEGAIKGMVDQLDPFSGYIGRRDARQFQQVVLEQRFDGIGIEVAIDPKTRQLRVSTPMVGTPAYEAGIQAGDLITAIDGRDTTGVALGQLSELLRGDSGGVVTLDVLRGGETKPREFRLVRREIKVDTVLGDTRKADDTWNFFLPGKDHLGYVRITSFGDRTAEEFEAALDELRAGGVRGLVLDLRDNPGGLLDSAADVAGLFLDAGDLLVTTRGREGKELERWVVERTGAYRQLPLVVLVNHDSASAAEIVAAALADHHRAIIVGERTYGKGTVQNVIPIEGGRSVLKLTIATYWRPSGKNIHRLDRSRRNDEWGVKPDAGDEVKLSNKAFAQWQKERRERDVIGAKTPSGAEQKAPLVDPQLDRAVECLEDEIARERAQRRSAASHSDWSAAGFLNKSARDFLSVATCDAPCCDAPPLPFLAACGTDVC